MQKAKQNDLWLQLMCCVSISHTGYIFWIKGWELEEWKTTGR